MRRWTTRIAIAGTLFIAAVMATVALNMQPGDPALYPPKPNEKAIPIYIVSYGYHSGLVVQRDDLLRETTTAHLPALRDVTIRFGDFSSIEFGWGDRRFYQSVRTIADVRISEALRALFWPGNTSVMHVVGLHDTPLSVFKSADMIEMNLSERGFARLASRLDQSFARDGAGKIEEMGPGLYGPSLFYRANGTFNLFNVCNHWVAHLLNAAGVPTNLLLATLPKGLFWDLAVRTDAHTITR
jgi:uncharacterized protein (TIGR02117 family)